MNRRKITYLFLCLVIISGIAISFENVRQSLLYHSIRLWKGDVLRFDCYTIEVPKYWTIHERENRKDKTIYTLRKFDSNSSSYIFISIVSDNSGEMLKHKSMKEKSYISIKGQEHVIYELTALGADNSVRLFTKLYDSPFVLAGESSKIITDYFDSANLLISIIKPTCNP